jgi:UDP-N-acetylglucosamine--N-acetylmuramyl-(pentapeptide) pyrophosphoryl-undecaprenol N-acetylglucosamine transferase
MDVIVCTGEEPEARLSGSGRDRGVESALEGEILWVGSSNGMERAIVETAGTDSRNSSGKLRRSFPLANFADSFVSRRTRGFVLAVPENPPRSSSPRRIRERSSRRGRCFSAFPYHARVGPRPGARTRLNAPFCRKISSPTRNLFPISPRGCRRSSGSRETRSASHTNGLRRTGSRSARFSGKKPILFVLGGSQGAREINVLVRTVLPKLLEYCDVVHQMGG